MIFLVTLTVFCFAGTGSAFMAKVERIVDGDTLVVTNIDKGSPKEGEKIKLRLYGVDAPETDQPYGDYATQLLKNRLQNKKVKIVAYGNDFYGRTIASVYAKHKANANLHINESLIVWGGAWIYDKYCKKTFCDLWQDYQKEARFEKIGLWEQKKPVEPWNWRK